MTSSSDGLDLGAMKQRFADRAAAVKQRNLPAVGGEERKLFIAQAQTDFQDYAVLADGEYTVEDGHLVIRVDLRPSTDH